MRAVTLGSCVLGALVAAGLGTLQAADQIPVTVAVLRGDGVLVPIATRTGKTWSQTWPVPVKAADVPLEVDDVPKRWWGKAGPTKTWRAWQIDGTSREVTVERPTWYLAHCQQGVGLKTALTARPPIPPPTVQPYPKLGLASSAPMTFKRIEALDQSSPLWIPMVDAVSKAVNRGEDEFARQRMSPMSGPPHPIPPAERAKVPVRIESLYRMPLRGGRFVYYVEATKRYGMPPLAAGRPSPAATPRRDGCSTMSFANGWFAIGEGEVPELETFVRVTSCEYDNVWLMLPLGYIDDGDEPVWIAQFTGWSAERYSLVRWQAEKKDTAAILDTHGGWCADE
jgi:hypothetical protein